MEPTNRSQQGDSGGARPGRPRRWADPQGDIAAWLDGLSPTAIRVTAVAKKILATEGLEQLTLERVALEANVDRATLRYHFPSKLALLHATWDRLQIDAWNRLVEQTRDIEPLRDRVRAYIHGLSALVSDTAAGQGMAELMPLGLRDPMLRSRLSLDYRLAEQAMLEVTGLSTSPSGDDPRSHELHTYAALVIAVIDGLAYRVALEPTFDTSPAFDILADMVVRTLLDDETTDSLDCGGQPA
jgi:AcrR family transcriptional regulator